MGKQVPAYLASLGSPGALLTVAANLVRDGICLTVFDRHGGLHTATLSESQARALVGHLREMTNALADKKPA